MDWRAGLDDNPAILAMLKPARVAGSLTIELSHVRG